MSVLVCENISKSENGPIKNFSYNFLDNQIYGLVGKNDSKIEELFSLISGETKPQSGKVVFYLPTAPSYFNGTPIIKIIARLSKSYPKLDNAYAYQILKKYGIDINAIYSKLTEREKSIVLGVLAIVSKANITIMNLPLKDADFKDKYDFFKTIYTDHESYSRTFIINTDFIDDITYLVDKILFFDKGKLISQFTVEEINDNFRYLSGKTEVVKSLVSGIKLLGYEDLGKTLTVCVGQKLSKDDIRKYQKYMIKISEVPIHIIYIYLVNLRELKDRF